MYSCNDRPAREESETIAAFNSSDKASEEPIEPTTRLKLQLAYAGTDFHGWQLQDGARTVQGCLEKALAQLVGRPVRVHGAGRTDAGVHALGQVAHVQVPARRGNLPWQRALNALLPQDVCVVEVQIVPDSFHARFDANRKTYSYTLWTEPTYVLPQRKGYVWPVGRLDLEAMVQASKYLVGRRDWSAFQNRGTPVRSTVRTVFDVHPEIGGRPNETVWFFSADGFLKQMVRNMMGCLVTVGKGKLCADQVEAILRQGSRASAPATAPARGLCLERVEYRESAACPDPVPDG
ncbi:tRNA pseudouridine38-40 synthase [Desulfonatronum thiosulfatophilum]|uniref:tRNA pseudouridine synthase A n=1 Tax=Desulfonatronum thiosulfatophilum TaxID=617002 RepID=A0A1G6CSG9_9BACT|nr:tRNA pseudouridine(38-40) synthase TruA [Desulfonatronum thiosulfatophilum]SDB35807.1 tRNA pseudouridine38-40 synthase [Desulfonatronum thiosulfatophilum]